MLRTSDSYIVGVDISHTDEAAMTIARSDGFKLDMANSLIGMEAEVVNNRLLSVKKPVVVKGLGNIYCPVCGANIHRMGQINFCYDCGQGLEWRPYK